MRLYSIVKMFVLGMYVLFLATIAIATLLSPWFNIWENALSDLGHAKRSPVAPIFNLGLATGGIMIIAFTISVLRLEETIPKIIMSLIGYFLVLIGVFDEVYGMLHFIVSVLFFLCLLSFLIYYGISRKRIDPVILVAINIIVWYLHFIKDLPPGAAIPELISVFSFLPYYTNLLRETSITTN